MTIGESVRAARLHRLLSQVELAKLAKTTQVTICRIEANSEAKLSTIIRVADALDMPIDELIGREVKHEQA